MFTKIYLKHSVIRLQPLAKPRPKSGLPWKNSGNQLQNNTVLAYQECALVLKTPSSTSTPEVASTDLSRRRIEVGRAMLLAGLPGNITDNLSRLLKCRDALQIEMFHLAGGV